MTLAERWERFWFAPASTATLAVFRAAYGVVLLVWTAAIAPTARSFFSRTGVLPSQRASGMRWGLLGWFGSDAAVYLVVALLGAAAICIAVGYRTRLASVVAFVGMLSLIRRNPFVFNSGDSLLRNISLFMVFAPSGAALSVDRWRRGRESFWLSAARAPWALRLVQVQISMVYVFTVWAKLRGERWLDGTAVGETMRVGDLVRFKIPFGPTDSLLLSNLMTYGTLVVEASLAILIWNRRLRPWVIAAGIGLHLFIEVTFALGFFSTIMIMSYIAFVPEDATERFLARVRGRLGRSRLSAWRRFAEPSGASPQATAASPVHSER